jgi:hypothetical protein
MADQNMIPAINAAGRFEAAAPFDQIVNQSTFYTVEATRTIHEMEGAKLDLYTLVFAPVGVTPEDFPVVLKRARDAGAIICALLDRNGLPVYVPTTYLTSFPLVDGVSYERMCMIADLGPVPPSMAQAMEQVLDHTKQYIQATLGISSVVRLGTVPTVGYVSQAQATAYENTRKGLITDTSNDVAKNRALTLKVASKDAYIAKLEADLIQTKAELTTEKANVVTEKAKTAAMKAALLEANAALVAASLPPIPVPT